MMKNDLAQAKLDTLLLQVITPGSSHLDFLCMGLFSQRSETEHQSLSKSSTLANPEPENLSRQRSPKTDLEAIERSTDEAELYQVVTMIRFVIRPRMAFPNWTRGIYRALGYFYVSTTKTISEKRLAHCMTAASTMFAMQGNVLRWFMGHFVEATTSKTTVCISFIMHSQTSSASSSSCCCGPLQTASSWFAKVKPLGWLSEQPPAKRRRTGDEWKKNFASKFVNKLTQASGSYTI